ncbi:hypothetical protein GSI_01530 [Ganoderma sinense ZZ0214-1]|uniref:DUF1793-domain-containing protein n=1 Tax=Ganoderma sinense ZZ0214-1 TaxID=1077348 RepID=A0A2G8SQ40_9APHY|nr:hypothetical protein GSI_01530 [Ganoderma sinense ZZ0214-1]
MLPSKLWPFLFVSPLCLVSAQGPVQTLFPAAVPLAVKTPYMSVWYKSVANSAPLSNNSPQFWNMAATMGWSGKIRVNGTTYRWMGDDATGTAANVTNVQITPTRSIFVMQAGPMNVTVTFLSPVEPDDWVKQSIPFSYVSVEAQSLDGHSYPVQVYSDISAEWASGDRSSQVVWSTANTDTGKAIYHEVQLQSSQPNAEKSDQAQDGKLYYAMSTSQPDISWQIDLNSTVHNAFQTDGVLGNSQSTAFASIYPKLIVFALAVNLGAIQATSSPVTWSVGYVRDPSIAYTTPGGGGAVQQRRPYYATAYPDSNNIRSVIDAFTGDYSGAHDRAVALDQKIMGAANEISSQYADVVALATRQAMGALDLTVGADSSGNVFPGDVKVFMKNLGTDRRVNPVEHIYAAFPMLLYLNSSLAGALLQPLLESQASLTDQQFAAADLGNAYPAATGPEAVSSQGVEQSGNMLIMELAHARISGNLTLLSQYHDTSKRWADYLASTALQSKNQTNQDGDSTDLANIALKGIIGVKAMAEIAHALGEGADATKYGNQASSLLTSWLSLATSSGGSRLLGSYGNQQSWSLMYNLFADKMLGLNFVSQSASIELVFDMQTQYLKSLLATAPRWGLPIDSESGPFGNTAWTLFASACVSDTTVRDTLINDVYNHANSNLSAGVFPEIYNTSDNTPSKGFASPAIGGVFSHLILTVPNQTISSNQGGGQPNGESRSSSHIGAIVGGVIGGLSAVGIAIAISVICLRNRRRRRQQYRYEATDTTEIAEAALQRPEPMRPRPLNPQRPEPMSLPYDQKTDLGSTSSDAPGNLAVTGADGIGASQALPLDPSEKMDLDEAPGREPQSAPSELATTSSNFGSQTGTALSRDLLSQMGSIATTDMVGLRAEVEDLRRVMQVIREERLQPPPEYVE